ncbi:lanthionine synthetase C family protein [Chitinophaga agrisoli]|uniref:Lanthionine synthetase C family protein n=1 Tax=Chitinophaga agrisoli TaxID=2607653 RepID=A0A5B2VMY9_9BACT|nr:lanthionine synthetase C family protein [Chitinophaga agrisoli]KAA2240184.1 lanthionine synthetase C family protein [Chitinophaga agrisoli]
MHQIVERILKQTDQLIEQHPPKRDYMLAGSLGLGLYYSQLYEHYEEEAYLDRCIRIIEDVFNKLNNGEPCLLGASLANGVAGLAYLTNLVAGKGWLNIDIESEFEVLEEYLFKSALQEIEVDCVDYLHGAFGCIHYFATRKHAETPRRYINELVDKLLSRIIREENGVWFRNLVLKKAAEQGANLGLAHGQCSMLMILMNVFDVLDNQEEVKKVIRQGVEYIMLQKRDIDPEEGRYNIFPFHINREEPEAATPNRLAWCYSDLNEVLLFYKAASFLKWDELKRLADLVGLQTLMRKDRPSTLIDDTHFCHGSAGVAQVYRRIYQESGLVAYEKGYEYWIEQTVLMLEHELRTDYYRGKESDLLEGLAGVGLTLLSFISRKELKWSEMLLL